MEWLDALGKNRQRGSFPRCLSLVADNRTTVAQKLTSLVRQPDVRVTEEDFWMPRGLPVRMGKDGWDKSPIEEAKLGEQVGFLSEGQRKDVTNWWLAAPFGANTPNWDIASTCTIGEQRGLLLVEAKAHQAELKKDGKSLSKRASAESVKNHEQIGRAIAEASAGLNKAVAGWNLSRDSHYQLANRFAWAWKLASMGIPVVLVYLGFLSAMEVNDLGESFADYAHWSGVLLAHSRNIVPERAWGHQIKVGSAAIRPLIRCWKQEL